MQSQMKGRLGFEVCTFFVGDVGQLYVLHVGWEEWHPGVEEGGYIVEKKKET